MLPHKHLANKRQRRGHSKFCTPTVIHFCQNNHGRGSRALTYHYLTHHLLKSSFSPHAIEPGVAPTWAFLFSKTTSSPWTSALAPLLKNSTEM
ncbi:hypothetical protein RCIA13 [Methanocella arvoryzae MRE50]|uniref:Uncharacterized protein n=1 Tax=Methanocella arvoryzae (strain DSM 22066 / NBRC 105507 / MRE50) TaxID=351160 RepID=Q0W797_METAR|nr:hypothetical protein orf29 [uncultured archaeon]CAJ35746.1 hypothetical protein RCIA13 [Methanocella arvoryzae MRE50]